MDNYDKNLKELDKKRNPLYEEAKSLETDNTGSTEGIEAGIEKAVADAALGLAEHERLSVYELVEQLENRMRQGPLSVADAKKFQKNINGRIYQGKPTTVEAQYRRNPISNGLKTIYSELRNTINEYINSVSTPEHNTVWNEVEQMTSEMGKLRDNRSNFRKEQQRKIDFAKKEKFAPTKELELKRKIERAKEDLKIAEQEHREAIKDIEKTHETETKQAEKQAKETTKIKQKETQQIIEAIGKETFDSVRKSKAKQDKLASGLQDVIDETKSQGGIKAAPYNWGITGIATVLGGWFGGVPGAIISGPLAKIVQSFGEAGVREYKAARYVLEHHPKIAADIAKTIAKSTASNAPLTLLQVKNIGKQIEEKVPKSMKAKRRLKIKSLGKY